MSSLRSRATGDAAGGAKSGPPDDQGDEKMALVRSKSGDNSTMYTIAITLISCLLLSTLYLLRHDNKQLGIAERKIRDLRRHVRFKNP